MMGRLEPALALSTIGALAPTPQSLLKTCIIPQDLLTEETL